MKYRQYVGERIENCETVVSGVLANDPKALTALYHGVMLFFPRLVAQVGFDEAEDLIHSAFSDLITYLKQNGIRTPAALPGLISSFVYFKTCKYIKRDNPRRRTHVNYLDQQVQSRLISEETPASSLDLSISLAAIRQQIAQLNPFDREFLVRFYFRQQDQRTIESEMNLSSNQYRHIRSRSLKRLRKLYLDSQTSQKFAGRKALYVRAKAA
jgi:RNA polymerase sigma factor (sigma-70 family)